LAQFYAAPMPILQKSVLAFYITTPARAPG
jgi:hypothetical protein